MRVLIFALVGAFVAGGAYANCGTEDCSVGVGEGGHAERSPNGYGYTSSGHRELGNATGVVEIPGPGRTTVVQTNPVISGAPAGFESGSTSGLIRDDRTVSGRVTQTINGVETVCTGQCEDSGYPLQ